MQSSMQPFDFGLRQSLAGSMDEDGSRYVPSSIYSGPGPVDDSPAPAPTRSFPPGALRAGFEEQQPRYNPVLRPALSDEASDRRGPVNQTQPRSSGLLNMQDPVTMHLLTETAISDSRDFEILTFEEVERLKKEKAFLRTRADATRRKLALESKLRDAAQSLNRLYSTRGKTDGPEPKAEKSRRSLLGSVKGGANETLSRADDEYMVSNRKIEELTRELTRLEKRLEEVQRRILEHTAGILQMTHRGLKKNLRRQELPRSPESMASLPNGSVSGMEGMDDFDERSLYQVPDYVTDFGRNIPSGRMSKNRASAREMQAIDDVASRLNELNKRLHTMIIHAGPQEHFDPPPQPTDEDMVGRVGAQIQAHLGYMSQGLDAMEAAQARTIGAAQKLVFDSEDQLENVNVRLHDMLQRTNSVSQSPMLPQDEPRGKDLPSQLAFSAVVLDRLSQRVQTLLEQKDILTRQIQQQRELNSKSDAQRDTQIRELTDELEETKRLHAMGEQEAQHSRDQINLLMEQLDRAKQDNVLLEQQRGAGENEAIEAERAARRDAEKKLLTDLQTKQDEHAQLQAQHDDAINVLQAQIHDLAAAKDEADREVTKTRAEMENLESEVVRVQTELTFVKAELDGAYGTRAQRAADVSMNPAIQKEIDNLNTRNKALEEQLDFLASQHEAKGAGSAELQNKVNALQKELKETIEDYEAMTKQSIEDEKERERLEELTDSLQQRCEALETQLSEEKVKWLGAKAGAPTEITSTMVLKNEFKKMMRDTRAENLKTLRVSQDTRLRADTC